MLFLVAMGERFKVRGVRIAANTVADGLLAVEGDPCSSFAAPPRFQAPRPRWDEIWSHGSGRRRRRMPVHRRTASLRSQAMRVQLTAAGRVGASASPRGDAGSRDGHAGGGGGRSPAASRRRDSANERRHRLRRRHSHVCVPFDLSPCDWARAAGWWVCHLDRSLGRGRLPPGVGATASTSGPRAHQASWCHDRPAPRPGQHHPEGMMCNGSGRGGVEGPGCACWAAFAGPAGRVRRVNRNNAGGGPR
jgi:hypothetical protein